MKTKDAMNDDEFDALNDEFPIDDDIDVFRKQRGLTMRHPILLIAVIIGASFLAYKTAPRASFYFEDLKQCGVLVERNEKKIKEPNSVPKLEHDSFCELVGLVPQSDALVTRKEDGTQPFVRGSVETLEDLELTARRVLCSSHPLVERIGEGLRESRAVLRAREALLAKYLLYGASALAIAAFALRHFRRRR